MYKVFLSHLSNCVLTYTEVDDVGIILLIGAIEFGLPFVGEVLAVV